MKGHQIRILCITDQFEPAEHSSVSGIFGGYLRDYCAVDIVYFSRELRTAAWQTKGIAVPYRNRSRIVRSLSEILDLSLYDFIVVRNYFTVLHDFLRHRKVFGYRLGFWNSFPHTYRRFFQAKIEGRAIWRKSIEYWIKSWLEKKQLLRCDFLIAMSPTFKDSFYPDLHLPFHPLPMGVDFSNLPKHHDLDVPTLRMIYTGTVDSLRRTGEVIEAISAVDGDFILDIFTTSENEVTKRIAAIGDPRIVIQSPLPRSELFKKMADYDLGIGLIPENKLYNVSSPTKTLEYYGMGIPAIINYLPEYKAIFTEESAFFCEFAGEAIQETISKVLSEPRQKLLLMGKTGQAAVIAQRDYRVLAKGLFAFFSNRAMARIGDSQKDA